MLLSETYIKNNSPITLNVQMKDLSSHIVSAQELYLRLILGDSFMEHLIKQYEAQSLTSEEANLVADYVQPALLWRMLYLAAPFAMSNWRNKGFIKNTDDFGVPTDFTEFKFLRNEIKNRAEVMEELLRKELCKNGSKFPKYKNQSGLTKPDGSSSFDSGLLFY